MTLKAAAFIDIGFSEAFMASSRLSRAALSRSSALRCFAHAAVTCLTASTIFVSTSAGRSTSDLPRSRNSKRGLATCRKKEIGSPGPACSSARSESRPSSKQPVPKRIAANRNRPVEAADHLCGRCGPGDGRTRTRSDTGRRRHRPRRACSAPMRRLRSWRGHALAEDAKVACFHRFARPLMLSSRRRTAGSPR